MGDVLDVRSWTTTGQPVFAVDADGQLMWVPDAEDVLLTDHEQRSTPLGGTITLRQVWNRDRTRLTRLVLEGTYGPHAPMFFAEARRPRGGWRGDELARLMLAVLTCGLT